jgi:hypothetical protein
MLSNMHMQTYTDRGLDAQKAQTWIRLYLFCRLQYAVTGDRGPKNLPQVRFRSSNMDHVCLLFWDITLGNSK